MFCSKTMGGVPLDFSFHGANLPRQTKSNTISCRATKLDMGRETNFYKVLSLENECVGVDEIKRAYRSMALRYHPDLCPPSRKEESTRMFVELHRAYETLSNPSSRRKYDDELQMSKSFGAFERAVQPEFSREIWVMQLSKLQRRSDRRVRERVVLRRT